MTLKIVHFHMMRGTKWFSFKLSQAFFLILVLVSRVYKSCLQLFSVLIVRITAFETPNTGSSLSYSQLVMGALSFYLNTDRLNTRLTLHFPSALRKASYPVWIIRGTKASPARLRTSAFLSSRHVSTEGMTFLSSGGSCLWGGKTSDNQPSN